MQNVTKAPSTARLGQNRLPKAKRSALLYLLNCNCLLGCPVTWTQARRSLVNKSTQDRDSIIAAEGLVSCTLICTSEAWVSSKQVTVSTNTQLTQQLTKPFYLNLI